MNQYTAVPDEVGPRQYDENGNLRQTGGAVAGLFEHDYLDRIVRAAHVPDIDSVRSTIFPA